MTEPAKTPDVVKPDAAATVKEAEVVKAAGVVKGKSEPEPEFIKVVTVKNPLPHAYDTSIRISNVIPTAVPNDGWTKCQLEAGILRLAE